MNVNLLSSHRVKTNVFCLLLVLWMSGCGESTPTELLDGADSLYTLSNQPAWQSTSIDTGVRFNFFEEPVTV